MIRIGLKLTAKTYCGFLFLSFLTIFKGVTSALRCSQCISDERGQCMKTAPPATPCETRGENSGPVHCMIAKRTDKTGTLVAFHRGCTGVILPKSDCWEQADNTTLCYIICSTDNCNSADHFHTTVFIVQTLAVVTCFLYNRFITT